MNQFQKKIERISLLVTFCLSVFGWILFDFKVFAGIWIGCMCALIGFRMIVKMALHLQPDAQKAKKQGIAGYISRYVFYGFIFVICAIKGIPLLSVLAGIMAHKVSLLIYTAIEKEDA